MKSPEDPIELFELGTTTIAGASFAKAAISADLGRGVARLPLPARSMPGSSDAVAAAGVDQL